MAFWLAALPLLAASQAGREERGKLKLSYFGKPAGVEEYRLEEFDDGQVALFSKAGFEIDVQGKKQTFTFDTVLTLDRDYAPVRYAGFHVAGGEKRQTKIEWKKGFAVPDQKPAVKTAAIHLLDNNVHSHYLALLRRLDPARRKFKVFNPALMADVEATLEVKGEVSLRSGEREVRATEVHLKVGALTATAHVDAGRRLLRISIPPVGALAELEGYEGWEIRPLGSESARPETIEEEEVAFASGGLTLAGSLTRPRGGAGGGPAVILVSDGGAEDRHGNDVAGRMDAPWMVGEASDCSFLRVVAWSLAGAGFAVLRWDDRGCGGSGGDLARARPTDLAADVAAAAAFLRGRGGAAVPLALVGHGEGGVVAAQAGAKDPAVKALILLGTPIRPLDEVLLGEIERTLRAQGTAPAPLRDILAKQKALFGEIRRSREDIMTIDERKTYIAGLRERLNLDVAAELRKAKASIAFLHGARDARAGSEDADRFGRARPEAAVRVFADLDRQFLRSGPGDRSVDAGFLKALAETLSSALK